MIGSEAGISLGAHLIGDLFVIKGIVGPDLRIEKRGFADVSVETTLKIVLVA